MLFFLTSNFAFCDALKTTPVDALRPEPRENKSKLRALIRSVKNLSVLPVKEVIQKKEVTPEKEVTPKLPTLILKIQLEVPEDREDPDGGWDPEENHGEKRIEEYAITLTPENELDIIFNENLREILLKAFPKKPKEIDEHNEYDKSRELVFMYRPYETFSGSIYSYRNYTHDLLIRKDTCLGDLFQISVYCSPKEYPSVKIEPRKKIVLPFRAVWVHTKCHDCGEKIPLDFLEDMLRTDPDQNTESRGLDHSEPMEYYCEKHHPRPLCLSFGCNEETDCSGCRESFICSRCKTGCTCVF